MLAGDVRANYFSGNILIGVESVAIDLGFLAVAADGIKVTPPYQKLPAFGREVESGRSCSLFHPFVAGTIVTGELT